MSDPLVELTTAFVREVCIAILWAFGEEGCPPSLLERKYENGYFVFDGHEYSILELNDPDRLNRIIETNFEPIQLVSTNGTYGISEAVKDNVRFYYLLLPNHDLADKLYPGKRKVWVRAAKAYLKPKKNKKRKASEMQSESTPSSAAVASTHVDAEVTKKAKLLAERRRREKEEAARRSEAQKEEERQLELLKKEQLKKLNTLTTPTMEASISASQEGKSNTTSTTTKRPSLIELATNVEAQRELVQSSIEQQQAAAQNVDSAPTTTSTPTAQDEVKEVPKLVFAKRVRGERSFYPEPFMLSSGVIATPYAPF